jgi:hypothetical protein
MKKTIVFVCAFLLLMTAAACKGEGKYADFEKAMNKHIEAIEKFAAGIEGAKNADDVVKAIEAYTIMGKDVIPQIKRSIANHPEFNDMKNFPTELKPIYEKVQAAEAKMDGLFSKFRDYFSDPKVKAAEAKLAEIEGQIR